MIKTEFGYFDHFPFRIVNHIHTRNCQQYEEILVQAVFPLLPHQMLVWSSHFYPVLALLHSHNHYICMSLCIKFDIVWYIKFTTSFAMWANGSNESNTWIRWLWLSHTYTSSLYTVTPHGSLNFHFLTAMYITAMHVTADKLNQFSTSSPLLQFVQTIYIHILCSVNC